jgi:prepilin-type N-terminal cleavage/methylation domain-containing protein
VKTGAGGYTLVELLISMAITSLVFMIAGTAIHQLSTVSGYGNDRMTAVHEMQNTAFWFNRDGQEALAASGDKNLILNMAGEGEVTYCLDGNTLQRISRTSSLTLAQNIGNLEFTVQDNLVTMNLTTMISGRSEESVQGTYKVHLRSVP